MFRAPCAIEALPGRRPPSVAARATPRRRDAGTPSDGRRATDDAASSVQSATRRALADATETRTRTLDASRARGSEATARARGRDANAMATTATGDDGRWEIGGNFDRDDVAGRARSAIESNRSSVKTRDGSLARKRVTESSPTNVLSAGSCASSETSEDGDRDGLDRGGEETRKFGARNAAVTTDSFESKGDEREERARHGRLMRPIAPSAENDGLQKRVSELRTALRTAEQVLDRTQNRLELAEGAKRAAEAETATLRARVWSLEGAEALAKGAESDGSLDSLRGRLLNKATVELSYAAKMTAAADRKVQILRQDCKKLQDTVAALSAASAAEHATLSMELEQARMRIRSDAREIASLTDRLKHVEENSDRLRGADESAKKAICQYQAAEKEAQQAKESLVETMRHNEFLQGRVNELEEMVKSDGTAHYDQELRRVREHLGNEIARLNADLKQERSGRKALEVELRDAIQTDTPKRIGSMEDAALDAERSKNAALVIEIGELKARLEQNHSYSGSPRKDDWSNALGLGGGDDEDDDGSVEALSPSGTPSRVRDALLAAARLEVQKLGEMNRKLVQAKLAAENESISKTEYEAALTRHNEAWASKVAEIELEVTKTKEQLATMQIQNEILSREIETSRLELDETKIANRELESSLLSRTSNQQQTTDEGSWLKLLPRRHSSPGVCTQQDNNLVCLGSWASLAGMDNSTDDDLCRLEENDVAEEVSQESIEQPSRKQLLEEKSRNIRERLASRRIKPPLSPLKLSEQAMERSIREGRLAMEAMKASRSSLLRASTSSLRTALSNTSTIDAMANVKT